MEGSLDVGAEAADVRFELAARRDEWHGADLQCDGVDVLFGGRHLARVLYHDLDFDNVVAERSSVAIDLTSPKCETRLDSVDGTLTGSYARGGKFCK